MRFGWVRLGLARRGEVRLGKALARHGRQGMAGGRMAKLNPRSGGGFAFSEVKMKQALVEEVARQADWRTQKAAEYPDDAERNLGLRTISGRSRQTCDTPRRMIRCGWPMRVRSRVGPVPDRRVVTAGSGLPGFGDIAPGNGRQFLRELLQAMQAEAA